MSQTPPGSPVSARRSRRQGLWWMLTVPHADFTPYLPPGVRYCTGQLERGGESGYLHWQLCLALSKKGSLATIKRLYGTSCHAELTRSDAAREYVHKVDTRVEGTQFELGKLPYRKDVATDWDEVRSSAIAGRYSPIPSDVFVRCYNALRRISADHLQPLGMERTIHVFWGRTGTGKSRRAWGEAGLDAFPKDPMSKFWDGYNGHEHVVIDEFRGGISISHILRWFDRYPVVVEIKGSSVVLRATTIWVTSNLDPRLWYPDVDQETVQALLRRLNITEFHYLLG